MSKHNLTFCVVAPTCDFRNGRAMRLRIKELREAREMTQEALGEVVGLEGATISRIERGQLTKTLDRLQRIAKALNVSPIDLFEVSDEDAERTALLVMLSQLPDEKKGALSALLDLPEIHAPSQETPVAEPGSAGQAQRPQR